MCDKCCNKLGNDFFVFGKDFTAPTEYANPFLKGRYRLTYTGVRKLKHGLEWEYLPNGGFKILLVGFAATPEISIEGEFY